MTNAANETVTAEAAGDSNFADESNSSTAPGLPDSGDQSNLAATEEPANSTRIKIGSQRESTPRGNEQPGYADSAAKSHGGPEAKLDEPRPGRLAAKVSSEIERQHGRVPVPSIRRGLSPDLEAELEAALGNASIDEIIGSERAAPPSEELAIESRVRGRVVSIHRDNVFIDIGQPIQGIMSLRQFTEPPEVGAVIEAVLNRYDGEEGLYELGLPGAAIEVGDWSQIAEGMVVEARVTGHNKGGLECDVNKLRGFIPAGQVSLYRVEDLATLVGEKWPVVVTEVKPEKRNLVLSRRAYLEREREQSRQKLLAELAPGQLREGIVRSLQPFGAFVDLGGVDGLVHVSEISWKRVSHPNEVLEIGQPVRVRIKKIDPETGKISLGLKELADSPWDQVATKYPIKSTASGRVSKIMEFGAFVELEPGVEGLVHISELDYKRVFRVTDVLQVGQDVDAQVLAVDAGARRISLSIKALKSRPELERKSEPEIEEPEVARPPRKERTDLKGGRGATSGGDKFGLKW